MQHPNTVPPYNNAYTVTGQPTNGDPNGAYSKNGPPSQYPMPQVGYAQPQQPGYNQPPMPLQQQPQGYAMQPVQYGGQRPGPPPGQPVIMMDRPPAIPGVPAGLEYLSQIDQLLIHQQVELMEIITGWEACNKYQIKNTLGQQVYFASEESDACARQCCGSQRGFLMHISDNFGVEVIRARREFKCCAGYSCCANFSCCAMEIVIEAPIGQVVGYATQTRSCLTPRYTISDSNKEPIFKVIGPTCICQGICCTQDVDFKIHSLDESQIVGKLSKQWGGFGREFFSDADNFSVTFPIDLDVKLKATLLGTLFLIDFMYFEQKQNNSN